MVSRLKMGSTTCTLCLVPYISNKVNKTDKNKLSSQMSAFYLVHTILDIPLYECSKYLEKYGNPADWVTLCPKCSVTLEEAQVVSRQLTKLQNRLDDLKEFMTNQMRLKVEDEEDFNHNYGRIDSAAYEIRKYFTYETYKINVLESFEEDKDDNSSENAEFEIEDNSLTEPSSLIEDPLALSIQVDNPDAEAVNRDKCVEADEGIDELGSLSPEPGHKSSTSSDGDELEDDNVSEVIESDASDSDYTPDLIGLSGLDVDSDQVGSRKSARLRESSKCVNYQDRDKPKDISHKRLKKLNNVSQIRHRNLGGVGHVVKCQDCGKIFKWQRHLNVHTKKVHSDVAKVNVTSTVAIPNFNLSTATSIVPIQTTDFNLVPSAPPIDSTSTGYRCIVCDKFFETLLILENHILSSHQPPSVSTCLGCNTNIPDSEQFNLHLHASSNPQCLLKSIRCIKCRKLNLQFATKESFNVHNIVNHSTPIPRLQNGLPYVAPISVIEIPSTSTVSSSKPMTTIDEPTSSVSIAEKPKKKKKQKKSPVSVLETNDPQKGPVPLSGDIENTIGLNLQPKFKFLKTPLALSTINRTSGRLYIHDKECISNMNTTNEYDSPYSNSFILSVAMHPLLYGLNVSERYKDKGSYMKRILEMNSGTGEKINTEGLRYPIEVSDISKFEDLNPKISINLHGLLVSKKDYAENEAEQVEHDDYIRSFSKSQDTRTYTVMEPSNKQLSFDRRKAYWRYLKNRVHPLYITKDSTREVPVDLLLLYNKNEAHYIFCRDYNSMMARPNGYRSFYCRGCLGGYTAATTFQAHRTSCMH